MFKSKKLLDFRLVTRCYGSTGFDAEQDSQVHAFNVASSREQLFVMDLEENVVRSVVAGEKEETHKRLFARDAATHATKSRRARKRVSGFKIFVASLRRCVRQILVAVGVGGEKVRHPVFARIIRQTHDLRFYRRSSYPSTVTQTFMNLRNSLTCCVLSNTVSVGANIKSSLFHIHSIACHMVATPLPTLASSAKDIPDFRPLFGSRI